MSFRISLEWFVKCQKNGDIRNDIKPEFLMYLLGKISEMISDPNLQNMYKSTGQLTRELLNFFFYGILGGHGIDHAEK